MRRYAWLLLASCGARTELGTGSHVVSDAGVDVADAVAPCSVAKLADTSAHPDAIVIDEGFVYWHDAAGISRVPKAGGEKELVVSVPAMLWPQLSPFAIAGGELYFANADAVASRVATSGGAVTTLGPTVVALTPFGFAASASHVYVWGVTWNVLQAFITQLDFNANETGGSEVPELPLEMAFAGDVPYVAADPDVYTIDFTNPAPHILSGLTATDLVVVGPVVYFTSDDATNGARVMHLDLKGGGAVPIDDTAGALALAQDGSDLYFTDALGLRVRRIANMTGPVTDVASVGPDFTPVDVALDGACVYWTSSGRTSSKSGGELRVAPKP